jgi:hypothetical protein
LYWLPTTTQQACAAQGCLNKKQLDNPHNHM